MKTSRLCSRRKLYSCGFAKRVRSYLPAPRQESWGSRRELQESSNMASSIIQLRRKEPARDPKAAPPAKRDSGALSGFHWGLPAPFHPFSEVTGGPKRAPRVAKKGSSQALGGHVSRLPMGARRSSEGLVPRISSELIRRPRGPDGLRPRAPGGPKTFLRSPPRLSGARRTATAGPRGAE